MPQYIFLCEECKKEFTLTLHIAELEKGWVRCPECGSRRVKQGVADFSAETSRKS